MNGILSSLILQSFVSSVLQSLTSPILTLISPSVLHSFIHFFSSRGLHLLHSPFVFDFATEVLPRRRSEAGTRIRALHKKLKGRDEVLEWEDLGAGSAGARPGWKRMPLGRIAARSGCRPLKGELLHRLCQHYQPQVCLELGTNLGLSTLYQYSAVPQARFITVEGAPVLAELARQQFEAFGLQPELIVGEFSQVLKQLDLPSLRPDYVYIDGNHRYEPTLSYFHALLPHLKDGGLMVFDDIYWSKEMQQAWQEICAHPEVSVSIDLFHLGLCFIRRPQAKEHFRISNIEYRISK